MTDGVPNYIVAYEASSSGRDALHLGIALARLTGAELRVCLVLPHEVAAPAASAPGAASYFALLKDQAEQWLGDALAHVPVGVVATGHIRWSESASEGLLEAAQEYASHRIVVGASRGGVLGRFTLGSVANALLHASPLPVALAPAGYTAPDAISRVTCAIGTRPGWRELIDSTAAITEGLEIDVRFVTLVEVDAAHAGPATSAPGREHLETVLAEYETRQRGSGAVSAEVAEGSTAAKAVEALEWRPDEIALVGSSRLAQRGRTFLGATAHRMLQALPVPLVVVPIVAA
jgi:nucleotide-binding universal stress UspA family protein